MARATKDKDFPGPGYQYSPQNPSSLYGPKGKMRNFAAMGDAKLTELWEYWDNIGLPLDHGLGHLPWVEPLQILNATYDLRFNGIPLPLDVLELLNALAQGGE